MLLTPLLVVDWLVVNWVLSPHRQVSVRVVAVSTIGANALRKGKKVVHYTLELNENYVGIRYDTIFTGIEPGKIPDNIDTDQRISTKNTW